MIFSTSETLAGMNVDRSVPKMATHDKNNNVAETKLNENIISFINPIK